MTVNPVNDRVATPPRIANIANIAIVVISKYEGSAVYKITNTSHQYESYNEVKWDRIRNPVFIYLLSATLVNYHSTTTTTSNANVYPHNFPSRLAQF